MMFELLAEKVKSHQIDTQSPMITAFRFEMAEFGALLAWLKAQHLFPQYYLNFRDSDNKIAALGKVRSFGDEISAQQFIEQTQQPLIGGLTFDKKGHFWLPRLLVEQQKDQVVISVFVDNQADLAQEKQQALSAIQTLTQFAELEPLNSQARLVSQKANQEEWCHWVEQALRAIEQGELNKVVLANESLFESAQPINAKDFLAESEKQNTGCYHFLYAETPESTFVGSTPERLFERSGVQVKTEALAGTALMSDDVQQNQAQADWLLHDQKNDDENWLVVKDICDNLQEFVSHIQVGDVELKQLRRVQHLRRRIQAELKPSFADAACLHAIHPTAAVSGLPQQNALAFLQKTENFDRTWYAGTLGMMTQSHGEFCVTIRCAFIEQNNIRIFAGAGIVAGSIPLLEWQEIERKASGLVTLLGTGK
ncbi:isochorismate synthase [Actinobacillus porcinus]|uniref:isochorismate synthase n=1 Tax=Actinobacillus porcinus TaxID=51048 RepID=UPI002353BCEA|nr:isochorismate synthase [Actinobacillus porcinus]